MDDTEIKGFCIILGIIAVWAVLKLVGAVNTSWWVITVIFWGPFVMALPYMIYRLFVNLRDLWTEFRKE